MLGDVTEPSALSVQTEVCGKDTTAGRFFVEVNRRRTVSPLGAPETLDHTPDCFSAWNKVRPPDEQRIDGDHLRARRQPPGGEQGAFLSAEGRAAPVIVPGDDNDNHCSTTTADEPADDLARRVQRHPDGLDVAAGDRHPLGRRRGFLGVGSSASLASLSSSSRVKHRGDPSIHFAGDMFFPERGESAHSASPSSASQSDAGASAR
jgi:hypothetical protein